ncbi:hypothetical protein HYS48_02275 [Candidatus Woesearchaeota archaeon]|nr:hypothetical protein [Candidatus Woesearchaeota archaeon]
MGLKAKAWLRTIGGAGNAWKLSQQRSGSVHVDGKGPVSFTNLELPEGITPRSPIWVTMDERTGKIIKIEKR